MKSVKPSIQIRPPSKKAESPIASARRLSVSSGSDASPVRLASNAPRISPRSKSFSFRGLSAASEARSRSSGVTQAFFSSFAAAASYSRESTVCSGFRTSDAFPAAERPSQQENPPPLSRRLIPSRRIGKTRIETSKLRLRREGSGYCRRIVRSGRPRRVKQLGTNIVKAAAPVLPRCIEQIHALVVFSGAGAAQNEGAWGSLPVVCHQYNKIRAVSPVDKRPEISNRSGY